MKIRKDYLAFGMPDYTALDLLNLVDKYLFCEAFFPRLLNHERDDIPSK